MHQQPALVRAFSIMVGMAREVNYVVLAEGEKEVLLVRVFDPQKSDSYPIGAKQFGHANAFDFGRRIQGIAAKHGVQSIDLTSVLARLPDAEQLYYVVDGHLTPEGQNVLAANMSAHLLGGTVPAFASCSGSKGGN